MEKNTVIKYDFDNNGLADKTEHTRETFMKNTLLTRFDKNMDGLSPHEFTGLSFLVADINNDKMIDIKEWQGSYIPAINKINETKALYNK